MAEQEYVVVCAGAYPTVAAAPAVLDTVQHLHKDELIGKYDAAVIDKENGKPHVVQRMDHPHIRVIPEWFGGGALQREHGDRCSRPSPGVTGHGLAVRLSQWPDHRAQAGGLASAGAR